MEGLRGREGVEVEGLSFARSFLVFWGCHKDYWFSIGFDWFFNDSHRFP